MIFNKCNKKNIVGDKCNDPYIIIENLYLHRKENIINVNNHNTYLSTNMQQLF